MQEQRLRPNVIVYSALISACGKGKQSERALDLFETMRCQGVLPDVIACGTLISACENRLEWALGMWYKM